MARGVNEKECFEYIQRQLFTDDALSNDVKIFQKERVRLTKRPVTSFFAMTEEDICDIEDIFFSAHPNDNPSVFPDFVSDKGFVEHFQITSSEVTEAGAMYKKDFRKHEKEFEQECEALKSEMSGKPTYGEIKQVEKAFSYRGEQSHAFLLRSLIGSTEKHIKSANDYCGNKDIRVFLIEYNELSLRVQITYPDVKPERMYGDLLRREDVTEYRISRDKEALHFLYSKKDFIDYVVFATEVGFEIVKVEDIPEILKLLVFDYEFHTVMLTTMSCMYGTSVPIGVNNNSGGDFECHD